MKVHTQWTHSDVWSQLATTPVWSFIIEDWQNAKTRWNSDRRVIYNPTPCIHSRHRAIHHRGVSYGSEGTRPLWRCHPARIEYFFVGLCSLQYRIFWNVSFFCQTLYCWLERQSIVLLGAYLSVQSLDYPTCRTKYCWHSVDAHFPKGVTYISCTVSDETADMTLYMNSWLIMTPS